VCATHVPRANLLYSPRNKILATSLLVEAFLYEEQTRRGISLKHWEDFEDVADHCTVCHKCLSALPGEDRLRRRDHEHAQPVAQDGQEELPPGQRGGHVLPQRHQPARPSSSCARPWWTWASRPSAWPTTCSSGLARKQTAAPPATLGAAPVKEQVIHFINKKMPGGLPKKTARALLDIEDKDYVPIIRNPQATTAETEAVFYFPGCGSERLFSQVGLATQAMLWHAGVQTVLPPGYLCCGYPQRGSGQFDKAEKIITDNRVLFHRVANTLNYLDIKTVVVSCGTCYDQLQGYEFEEIFPGCRIIDIHEYLLEKGITLPRAGRLPVPRPLPQPDEAAGPDEDGEGAGRRQRAGEQALLRRERHAGRDPAGHLHPGALPQGRGARKGEAALRARQRGDTGANVKILTSCPSCLQGLKRYGDDLKNGLLEADYIVVEMARRSWARDWLPTTWRRPTPAASSACWSEGPPSGARKGDTPHGQGHDPHSWLNPMDCQDTPDTHRHHRAPGIARAGGRLSPTAACSACPSS
jgi:hypothetical protein